MLVYFVSINMSEQQSVGVRIIFNTTVAKRLKPNLKINQHDSPKQKNITICFIEQKISPSTVATDKN